ncbi:hypothetical protein NA57DRAFT_59027 [Rhizodiscina lignyota]|uniref:Zn(2)-C6 fungal-type domain-containing protein n=1 Tax=Rhizodiscina lignyota TaxID=1504668 RepID=A0A9P4M7M3_9PEZI|nr:hypothetical protein NA57DRAFT_59027 [Rhizodiscina lignyota]
MSQPQRVLLPRRPGVPANDESLGRFRQGGAKEKVKAACCSCRSKRVKCDGNRPTCSNCRGKPTACEYDAAPGQTKGEARKEMATRMEVDNASMLELFWRLQTVSVQDAHEFLNFLRSGTGINIPSMQSWFQARLPNIKNSRFPTYEGENERNASSHLVQLDSPKGRQLGRSITVAIVQKAVDTFFNCTGMLFYVFSKEQIDTISNDMLGHIQQPETTSFARVVKESGQHKAQLGELCGMAAVGALYLRNFSQERLPPADQAEYLYTIAKEMLDGAIHANPARAMKLCALLSMTLVLFSGASLGYVSAQAGLCLQSLQEGQLTKDEHAIQQELLKVTVMKAKIVRVMASSVPITDPSVGAIRKELKTIHQELPQWLALSSVMDVDMRQDTPFRRLICYLHLFFLSAMMLVHRRVMAHPQDVSSSAGNEHIRAAARDGIMAAKMAARILSMMRDEGAIVQLCWMCIFSSYTTTLILLQAAVQKILTGYPSSTWAADLSLAKMSMGTLQFCAELDDVALQLYTTISSYFHVVQDALDVEQNEDLWGSTEEGEDLDYLLVIPPGDTDLSKAARDLLYLVQNPFSRTLEMVPEREANLQLRDRLVNWMEAVVGTPHEWKWELQSCELGDPGSTSARLLCGSTMIDSMAKLIPGHFESTTSAPVTPMWTDWTPHMGRSSFLL